MKWPVHYKANGLDPDPISLLIHFYVEEREFELWMSPLETSSYAIELKIFGKILTQYEKTGHSII